MTWGVETHLIERFGEAGVPREKISMVRDTYSFISPDRGPAEIIASFERFYGPTMNAVDAAQKNGKARGTPLPTGGAGPEAQNKSANGGTSHPRHFPARDGESLRTQKWERFK